jgi:DNA-binding NarL/FixJ family response regulator
MVLTSKQREKLVLHLYNEGKTIEEIAKEANMSFTD